MTDKSIGWVVGWNLPTTVSRTELAEFTQFLERWGMLPTINPRRAVLAAVDALDAELAAERKRCRLVKPPASPHNVWVLLLQILDPDADRVRLELRAIVELVDSVMTFVEYQGGSDIRDAARRLLQLYNDRLNDVYTADISGAAVKVLVRRFGAIRLNKNGGSYYVPFREKALSFIESWRRFGEAIGGTVYVFDVHGHVHEVQVIAKLFVEYVNEYVVEARIRLQRKLRPDTIAEFAGELQDVLAHIELYRQVVGVTGEAVDLAEQTLKSFIVELTSLAEAPEPAVA